MALAGVRQIFEMAQENNRLRESSGIRRAFRHRSPSACESEDYDTTDSALQPFVRNFFTRLPWLHLAQVSTGFAVFQDHGSNSIDMLDVSMTNRDGNLAAPRMKGMKDINFKRRTPGIMTLVSRYS